MGASSDKYWYVWLSFGSAIGIAASLIFRDSKTSSVVFFAVVVAMLGILGALPWLFRAGGAAGGMVRLRWSVIGLAGLTALLLIGRRRGLYIFAALTLAWLGIVNTLIFALRRFTAGIPAPAESTLYFLGDLWLVAALSYLGLGWYYIACLLVVSAVLVMLCGRLPSWLLAIMLTIYGVFLPLVLPSADITFAIYLALIVVGAGALAHHLGSRIGGMREAKSSRD